MNKIAIITALTGNRVDLHTPKYIHENADYFAFTEKDWKVKIWTQIPIYSFSNIDNKWTNRRNAKIYKVFPELFIYHYDYYIWTDCVHNVKMDPQKIIDDYLKDKDIAVFRHTTRNCAYKEAHELHGLQYDHLSNINEIVKFLEERGYPENNGLYEMSAFVRKNNRATKKLMLSWWEMICRFSSRDQLSFNYCLNEHNIDVAILPGYANGYNEYGKIGNNDLIPQVWGYKY